MCFLLPKKVKGVKDKKLYMEDGQRVKPGSLKRIAPGDYLLIYGNLALEKVEKSQALKIREMLKLLKS